MDGEIWAQIGLFVTGAVILGRWAYKNVWLGPKTVCAVVLEKTWEEAPMRLPDVAPGFGGVFNASITNILILDIDGTRVRCTANDESWKRVGVGDTIKAWIQDKTHVVGVYVWAKGSTR